MQLKQEVPAVAHRRYKGMGRWAKGRVCEVSGAERGVTYHGLSKFGIRNSECGVRSAEWSQPGGDWG
jgi:hypothetical protein